MAMAAGLVALAPHIDLERPQPAPAEEKSMPSECGFKTIHASVAEITRRGILFHTLSALTSMAFRKVTPTNGLPKLDKPGELALIVPGIECPARSDVFANRANGPRRAGRGPGFPINAFDSCNGVLGPADLHCRQHSG